MVSLAPLYKLSRPYCGRTSRLSLYIILASNTDLVVNQLVTVGIVDVAISQQEVQVFKVTDQDTKLPELCCPRKGSKRPEETLDQAFNSAGLQHDFGVYRIDSEL